MLYASDSLNSILHSIQFIHQTYTRYKLNQTKSNYTYHTMNYWRTNFFYFQFRYFLGAIAAITVKTTLQLFLSIFFLAESYAYPRLFLNRIDGTYVYVMSVMWCIFVSEFFSLSLYICLSVRTYCVYGGRNVRAIFWVFSQSALGRLMVTENNNVPSGMGYVWEGERERKRDSGM